MERDKKLHLIAGAAVAAAAGVLFDPVGAFLTGLAAGLLKEVYDTVTYLYDRWYLKRPARHTPSYDDFVFTAIGSFLGYVFILAVT